LIVIINSVFDPEVRDPEALLERYHALSGWARALVQAGADEVTVLQRFWRDHDLRADGVDYRFLYDGPSPSVRAWYLGDRVAKTARDLRPAVVHVHGMVFPLHVGRLRSRLHSTTALLVQDHGALYDGHPAFRRWGWRALYRFGLRAADGFLFTAATQADAWRRAGIISDEQAIYAVPEASPGLGAPSLSDGGQARLPGRPALLWVGRLVPFKDPLTVLAGFERALDRLPDAAITLVFGSDDLLPEVRRRVEERPTLRGRVHLAGRVEWRQLPAFYAGADLFLLGSHHEVAGFALLEALSFGVTPVVTDIPAFRAITDGGRVGALYPVGDADALADALVRLGSTDLQSGRAAILEHFSRALSWPAIGRRALDIYREAGRRRHLSRG
jgi:glycosyltransferase involved in cell wall biosynthesis